MKDEEKNLIENLFHRLKNAELNSLQRDNEADELIQKLTKQQPHSSYYMAQTILIQETAIKKLSMQIEELKKTITTLTKEKSNKQPSFLSNFFKKNPTSQTAPLNENNVWKKNENNLQSSYNHAKVSSPIEQVTATASNGFLKNALQTATGVAGGMILGNMLMNAFNHSEPEQNFDAANNDLFSKNYIEEEIILNQNDDNLINYEKNEEDNDSRIPGTETINNNDQENNYENSYNDLIDHDDDHFI